MDTADSSRRLHLRWFLPSVTIGAVAIATALLVTEATRATVWPIDSYFYLDKAKRLVAGEGLSLSWSGEVDPKYFPGYSLLVAPLWVLAGFQPWFWIALQVVLLWSAAGLMGAVTRGFTGSQRCAWAAAALWAVHPQTLKWMAVPMAEGCATALMLGAVAVHQRGGRAPCPWRAVAVGVLAGLAISTRIEAAVLGLALALHWAVRRRLARLRWILWGNLGLLVGLTPLIVWLLAVAAGEQTRRTDYFNVLAAQGLSEQWLWLIPRSLAILSGFEAIHTPPLLVDAALILLHAAVLAALLLGLVGLLGRGGLAVAVLLCLYLAGHCLWYYFSDRHFVIAVPAVVLLLILCGRRQAGTLPVPPTRRRLVAAAVLLVSLACWLLVSADHLHQHRLLLARFNPWHPAKLAQLVEIHSLEGVPVITDLGPVLAYHLSSPPLLLAGEEHYYNPTLDPDELTDAILRKGIRVVVTRHSREEWLAQMSLPTDAGDAFREVPSLSQATVLLIDHDRLRAELESRKRRPQS